VVGAERVEGHEDEVAGDLRRRVLAEGEKEGNQKSDL
jgi:hypothetical protein